jgi:ATP-dependent DNA helicase RecG
MAAITFADPITKLPSIGDAYAAKLVKLGINTIGDLVHHYPFRYVNLSQTATVATVRIGDTITLTGTIIDIQSVHLKFGKTIQKAKFSDGTGIMSISWFNQPYLATTFKQHPTISLSGTIKAFSGKPTLSSPQYELINDSRLTTPDSRLHTGRLVPVYPETAGVSSKWLRAKIKKVFDLLPPINDWLPSSILHDYSLNNYAFALHQIHFPDNQSAADQAKHRLSFDELFLWQCIAKRRKRQQKTQPNYFKIPFDQQNHQEFLGSLPFELTLSQQKAIADIQADVTKDVPMNRLLQGDVGAGKTVVAAAAIYHTVKAGYKAIFMAPTEILVLQHAKNIKALLEPLGISVMVASKSQKQDVTKADVVIGTQAVLFRSLPDPIGLIVIDEQHRFGVNQRGQLLNTQKPPHLLAMTATPIPRTIALTLYAALDISLLDEVPAGRLPIKTWVVPESKRDGGYAWIKQQIDQGGQVFIVCPLIEGSDDEAMSEIKAAETEFKRLQQDIFPGYQLALVHGKMKSKEKDSVIQQFSDKKTQILVATPVVEVGIDIKGATIMVIEGAERFGLAQLHQLRGRVGRNNFQSYCLLFTTHPQDNDKARLKAMETCQSGFELAELDLKLRGPGDLYGTHQSGFIDLKIASLNDEQLIQQTHQASSALLTSDPTLAQFPSVLQKVDELNQTITAAN